MAAAAAVVVVVVVVVVVGGGVVGGVGVGVVARCGGCGAVVVVVVVAVVRVRTDRRSGGERTQAKGLDASPSRSQQHAILQSGTPQRFGIAGRICLFASACVYAPWPLQLEGQPRALRQPLLFPPQEALS